MEHPVDYRVISELEDIEEVVELQKTVWGEEVITSLPHLVAAMHNGGVVIGAYKEDKVIGFCYGFAGYQQGESYLCSHMLAIIPEYRNKGIGRELKLQQRLWALKNKYSKIIWTYDPLETRNGYLNLCILGGFSKTYIRSYYGQMNDQLNKGMPSDRLVVEWPLNSKRVELALAGAGYNSKWESYPKLFGWKFNGDDPVPESYFIEVNDQVGYLLPVPNSIHQIKKNDIDLAREWRLCLRRELSNILAKGFKVVGLVKKENNLHCYVLERSFHHL